MPETHEDRDALVELMARYAAMLDTKGWDALPRSVLTDQVMWDFSSFTGQPPFELDRDALVARIRTGFAALTATHHAITNHRISIAENRAEIRAHIRAEHWLPESLVESGSNCWLVVGFYDDEAIRTAEGWRLSRVRLTVTHQENGHLAPIAFAEGQRMAASH
jgi:3-phenylpropionate/cinnamic acid dioxygenase small subunit